MLMLKVIIKPYKLDEVTYALFELGIRGMTVTEVLGYGRQKGRYETYDGSEYMVEFIPKIMLEIVIHEHMKQEVVEVIIDKGQIGKLGDGKIFIIPVEKMIRIRTGETDENSSP